jgi:hypothetical protein
MKQTEIVKRAFRLTLRYPVLWIFGILVALTGGRGWPSNSNYRLDRGGGRGAMPQIPGIESVSPGAWAAIAVAICSLLLVIVVVTILLQYVSRTALYRLVDGIEETGEKPTWRRGFRLGWSNRAFRLFLLELIVGLVVGIGAIVLLALAASPLLFLLIDSPAARWTGIGLTVALELVALLILLVVVIAVYVLGQFWSREIVLANRGIGAAFAGGYHLVRDRIKDVGLMWLLLFAVGFVWMLVLLPIVLLVTLAAAGLGMGVGFGVYGITHSAPWGVLAGLPVFMVIAVVPLTFLGGLYTVFNSSAWTLAYREVLHDNGQAEVLPVATAA